jgi:glycosyltransferase involved in cell wall biosynthesis
MSVDPRPLAIVFGVFPPPVTGMTLCTECIADHLAKRLNVYRANVSNNAARITWSFRLKKLLRALAMLLRLATRPQFRGAVLYMPLNAVAALYYNIAAALIARLRGWPTAVHHHVYLYINRYDWRLRLLDRLLGPSGLHLVLCTTMRAQLVELYRLKTPCAIVPSTILVLGQDDHSAPALSNGAGDTLRRLGHMSNLCKSKGTLLAIDTFAKLRDSGEDIKLVVAGPILEPEVEQGIAAAKQRYPESFDYRGPVYGDAKQRFFEDIDLFLFPSTYPQEAQPIVLSEAFSYGKPALAIGISCIPSLMGQPGWHVPRGVNFTDFAANLITKWRDDPNEYAAARQLALRRVEGLKQEAQQALENLAAWARGEETGDFITRSTAEHKT